MGDLISREAVLSLIKRACNPYGKPSIDFEVGKRMMQVVEQMPSADIMECARAIKEYCEKERINCAECLFYDCERDLSCVLRDPCMSWDLPEGDKE